MIIGIGNDIINIARLKESAAFLNHLQQRILGVDELAELQHNPPAGLQEWRCRMAKYFAGKEAVAKALGTGFRAGIYLRDIQILHDDYGKPIVQISGAAAQKLRQLAAKTQILLTLSDDYPYAAAVAVIETIS